MTEVPEGLYYTKEHEWMRIEGDEIFIGITDHAQDALTDIVYIELPAENEQLEEMAEFAIVESVKSASPIFTPVSGTITAVNQALDDAPELMNQDPYGEGWIIKFRPDDMVTVTSSLSASDYISIIAE
jgi:glycine cleavage system H protein